MGRSQAIGSRAADLVAEIETLHEKMRARASAGQWSGFGDLLARRDELLGQVAEVQRAPVLTAALQCNERVLECAHADRDAAAGRVEALQKRRNIGSFYRRNGGRDGSSM